MVDTDIPTDTTPTDTTPTTRLEMVCETHFFTSLRYKNPADNGFSGNLAMLLEAVQNSDKVLDDDLKLLAKSILQSVIKHKVIVHSTEDIKKAVEKKQEEEQAKKMNETILEVVMEEDEGHTPSE